MEEKTIDSETASQWQRNFLKKLKASAAGRLSLPPSSVKGSISIGMSRTHRAPALETIPAPAEEGWPWTTSSAWFGFCCSFLWPKFSNWSASCQASRSLGLGRGVTGLSLLRLSRGACCPKRHPVCMLRCLKFALVSRGAEQINAS